MGAAMPLPLLWPGIKAFSCASATPRPCQELEGEEGRCIPLQPGQATLHHIRLAHRSGPAAPDSQMRLGLAIRYMAAHVQQSLDPRDSGEELGWGRGAGIWGSMLGFRQACADCVGSSDG